MDMTGGFGRAIVYTQVLVNIVLAMPDDYS